MKMRFIKDGPQIPSDLLIARDQGRVVFFCGAGVSRARAGLPDFFGLTEKVIKNLGVLDDDPVRKLLDEAYEIEGRTGVAGLISADRMFGLLEKDFSTTDIISEVASALKPSKNTDLSAHKTLLNLATTPDGRVQLVTTNFDRLFDDCRQDLPPWQPPRLPNPERAADMHGVVYLHGKVANDYCSSEGDGLVLSSSDFGKAYLAEGWATQFFKDVIKNYQVVFIGYSADDPPVQYLLEALSTSGKLDGVYAFQSGNNSEAESKWLHKGVTAIPYSDDDEHLALWDTLEAWSQRAKDIDGWYAETIKKAQELPQYLEPHERGQIAHVISTTDGAQRFSSAKGIPRAEWLCVFDPARRYKKQIQGGFIDPLEEIDAFKYYCLDFDSAPDYSENTFDSRAPLGAWDALALNEQDKKEANASHIAHLVGSGASQPSKLPPRLIHITDWISKIAEQPATVWWAVRQNELHPELKNKILWRMRACPSEETRRAWRYLTADTPALQQTSHHSLYHIESELKQGWDAHKIQYYLDCFKPYLIIEEGYVNNTIPQFSNDEEGLSDLFKLKVKYPNYKHPRLKAPDEWLKTVVTHARKNLETAVALEVESGCGGFFFVEPIEPSLDPDEFGRYDSGLKGEIRIFTNLFRRLTVVDEAAARNEFLNWPKDESYLFPLLRIWAMRFEGVIRNEEIGNILDSIDHKSFWDATFEKDLLSTIMARWDGLDTATQIEFEERLRQSATKEEKLETQQSRNYHARRVLNRLHWLSRNGCALNLDLDELTTELRSDDFDWEPEDAESITQPMIRSGVVSTDIKCDELLREPIASLLVKAEELKGEREFLKAKDPFRGLVREHPHRAFLALRLAAKQGEFPKWAWEAFFYSDSRKEDKLKFSLLITKRIVRLTNQNIAPLVREIVHWLSAISDDLADQHPEAFDCFFLKIVQVLSEFPEAGESSISANKDTWEWTSQAINSPVGQLSRIIFKDKRVKNKYSSDVLKDHGGLPKDWSKSVEKLLALPNDLRLYSLAGMLALQTPWLYEIDPAWTEDNLLCLFASGNQDEKDAFWGGFFSKWQIPNNELYQKLKPYCLELAKTSYNENGQKKVLAAFLLLGWLNMDSQLRWVSSNELRKVLVRSDETFRIDVLHQLETWLENGDEKCCAELPIFLKEVWPRQLAVRSPAISVRLFQVACARKELFVDSFELIRPMLTKIDHLQFSVRNKNNKGVVTAQPRALLEALSLILPKDWQVWPYEIGDIFKCLIESDQALENDPLLVELKRTWDAR